jgi:hypothetical protein
MIAYEYYKNDDQYEEYWQDCRLAKAEINAKKKENSNDNPCC